MDDDRSPLWVFPLVALGILGFFALAALLAGGFFADPVGPVRGVVGGIVGLLSIGLMVGGVRSRDSAEFALGCFLISIALATLLGVPDCTDCPG
jgi:hypothetical protein